MQPAFSVVMPCLNGVRFLERALRSVLDQADPADEVMAVDGGSTDGSVETIRRYSERLAWWVSEPDAGQSSALNKAFARARNPFLLWINADDVLLPGTLATARAHLGADPSCSWLAGNVLYLDESDRVLWCARDGEWHDFLFRHAPVRVYGPTSIFRREAWDAAGRFDEGLRYAMDTDLWLRFRRRGLRFHRIPHYCWGFRVHAGSRTTPDLMGRPDAAMRAELDCVAEKNGLAITRTGLLQQRLWRLLNGCYARAWFDTVRWRGRRVEGFLNAKTQRRKDAKGFCSH
jgi:glycosyltransferase involved in cell wall biosynthesis